MPNFISIAALVVLGACGLSHDRPDALDSSVAEPDGSVFDGASPPDSSSVVDTRLDPIAVDELCAAYAETKCARRAGCDCPRSLTAEACEDVETTRCEEVGYGGAWLEEAISTGRVVYDGEAAARYLRALGDAPGCQYGTVDWAAMITFGGAIRGTLSAGSPCTEDWFFTDPFRYTSECEDGLCMLGEEDELSCVPFVAPGTPCDHRGDCFPSLTRNLTGLVCYLGECTPGIETGAACTWSAECESSTCFDGICGPLQGAEGDACSPSTFACGDDLYCATPEEGEAGACTLRHPLGAACSSDEMCADARCLDGICAPGVCLAGMEW